MKSKNTNKARIFWVLIVILAYSAQSFAFVGHMGSAVNPSSERVMHGCHSDEHEEMPSKTASMMDCCEDGCSMVGCHTASALLNSFYFPAFHLHQAHGEDVGIQFVSKLSSTLYRPPISR